MKEARFKDKYCRKEVMEANKIRLSNDAYAVGEMLQDLSSKIMLLRLALIRQ